MMTGEAFAVSGIVVDASGRAVSATVWLLPDFRRHLSMRPLMASSASDGSFRFEGVGPGEYKVSANLDSHGFGSFIEVVDVSSEDLSSQALSSQDFSLHDSPDAETDMPSSPSVLQRVAVVDRDVEGLRVVARAS